LRADAERAAKDWRVYLAGRDEYGGGCHDPAYEPIQPHDAAYGRAGAHEPHLVGERRHGHHNGSARPYEQDFADHRGAAPVAYNGTYYCTITGASTFTYPFDAKSGAGTTPGVYTPEDVAELVAMATTFFAQSSQQAVYVLELGAGNIAAGVTFLTAWIAANPGKFYSYLVPRYWDGDASFLTMLGAFNALTAKTYFFVTTSLQNWQLYTAQMKCVEP